MFFLVCFYGVGLVMGVRFHFVLPHAAPFLLNRVELRLHLPLRSTLLVTPVLWLLSSRCLYCLFLHRHYVRNRGFRLRCGQNCCFFRDLWGRSIAHAAIATSLARFANVVMTHVFRVCCVVASSMAWSCLSASASVDAICVSSSLFALRSRC